MHPLIVIPARLGSVRLPGKPLCKINGQPLVRHVVQNVLNFKTDARIVVATDDEQVSDAVADMAVQAVITSENHRSGTERVAEVARRSEYSDLNQILNVQGDQPFLPKEAALGALDQLRAGFQIGTAAVPLKPHQKSNRNRVKVAVDAKGRALTFSREMPTVAALGQKAGVFLHLGIYAYTRESLIRWVNLPPTAAESDENLEQLRPLLQGTPIGVSLLNDTVETGIDTMDDLERAQSLNASTRKDA